MSELKLKIVLVGERGAHQLCRVEDRDRPADQRRVPGCLRRRDGRPVPVDGPVEEQERVGSEGSAKHRLAGMTGNEEKELVHELLTGLGDISGERAAGVPGRLHDRALRGVAQIEDRRQRDGEIPDPQPAEAVLGPLASRNDRPQSGAEARVDGVGEGALDEGLQVRGRDELYVAEGDGVGVVTRADQPEPALELHVGESRL